MAGRCCYSGEVIDSAIVEMARRRSTAFLSLVAGVSVGMRRIIGQMRPVGIIRPGLALSRIIPHRDSEGVDLDPAVVQRGSQLMQVGFYRLLEVRALDRD